MFALEDITYSSVVVFEQAITDAHFVEVFPSIQKTLFWLEQNVGKLAKRVENNLPDHADVGTFRQLHIISFSLYFEEKSVMPAIQIAFGNDYGETYLIAVIKDRQITSVDLN